MLYVVLPFYWHEAGLHSLLEAGILLSVNRLVRLPLGLLAGWLLQKVSVKRGLPLAVVLASVTTAARSNQGSHLLTATLLCAAPLFALVPVALPPLLWLGIIIAIQLSATALTILADATASQAAAPMPSGKTFLTLYSVLQDTGAALGPLLGYLLPVDWLFRLCALLLLGLAACWYGKKKNECRKGLAEIRMLM
jgi:MFS family permease